MPRSLRAGAAEAQEALRGRIQALMAARLLLSAGAFALALFAVGVGHDEAMLSERGLYGALAAAFGATLVQGIAFRRVRRLGRFALLQLATDVSLVAALVSFSGGRESIFAFLFLPIPVTGAILFERRGAYGAAAGAALGHGLALLAADWLGLGFFGPGPLRAPLLAFWVAHAAALLLVALLASALVRELRQTGVALRKSAHEVDRLRRLHERTVASLTSGLVTVDAAGRITSLNPEGARISGWEAAQAEGRELEDVLPGVEPALGAHGERARSRLRVPFRGRDQVERHLGVAASQLRDEQGRESGRVVIFQDVSEVVAMEQELRRSERLAAAGELAAHMAHEIRNPLAAISGSVQMLAGAFAEPEQARERERLLGIVLREVERLDHLLGDFLTYARPPAARPTRVELAPLVEEVAGMFAAGELPDLELEVEVPARLAVRADARQLRQLLWNLLLNASQAMPEGGRIRIDAASCRPPPQGVAAGGRNEPERDSPWVEITVADTGTGIEAELLERIFDPFFTTKRGGTGLGLATVHRVVESSGGALQVESEVGKGTAFRIRLPAVEHRP